jgi:two-component system, LytTR family, response regulator
MSNIKVLIADDEAPARERMKRLLGRFPEIHVIGEASNGIETLKQAQQMKPDVVFLDIEMPELDGLSVAQALGPDGPIAIFVTAYDDHALRAFEICAMDYLVKPVSDARLEMTVARIKRLLAPEGRSEFFKALRALEFMKPGRRLAIRCGNRYLTFDPLQVSAIHARDHYSELVVDGRTLLADDPLDSLVERLNPEIFVRIHRSAVINLNYLDQLERQGDRKYIAILSDPMKSRVPVSRERLPDLKTRLGVDA